MFPRLRAFKKDLAAAGIAFEDEFGRRFDLHAARKTFNTRMATNGVPTRAAMHAMRHSEERLTTQVYTDATHLAVAQHVASLLPEPVPGKWWGRFNKANIPWAERKEIALPVRVRIHSQRVGRKIRRKRMAAAKHAAIMAKIKKAYHLPYVSAFQLQCGKHHRPGTLLGELYRKLARDLGDPFGKCGNSPSLRYSSVTLAGKHAPSTVGRILTYGGHKAKEEQENQPF